MNILALDTSSRHFSLAVAKNGKVLRSRNIVLKKVLSDSIMPAIGGILKKAGLTIDELDGFAVGLGPGSFTSLRVGLSTVKGLAFATGKPVVGVSSLDILALNGTGDGQVCVVCDAKRNLVYACLYEKKGTALKKKSKYLLTDIGNVLKQVKDDVTFVGDGIPLFRAVIEKAAGIKPQFAGEKQMYPQARHLAALALERFKAKKYDDAETLVPLYLYPEDCQIQKSGLSTRSGSLKKESRMKPRKVESKRGGSE